MEIEKKTSSTQSENSNPREKMVSEGRQFIACTQQIHNLRISHPSLKGRQSKASSIMSKASNRSSLSTDFLETPENVGPLFEQKMSIQSNASDKLKKKLQSNDLFEEITKESQMTPQFTNPYHMSYSKKGQKNQNNESSSTMALPVRLRLSQEAPISKNTLPMELVYEDPQQYELVISSTPSNIETNLEPNQIPTPKVAAGDLSCKCHKSKCILMYCQCFSHGRLCTDKCECHPCRNNEHCKEKLEQAKGVVLSKDPEAFNSKIQLIDSGDSQMRVGYKRGCNCKKTMCYKKYCECYYAGVKCTPLCKCCDCLNGGDNAFKQ